MSLNNLKDFKRDIFVLLSIFVLLLSPFYAHAAIETINYDYDDARQITKATYSDGTDVEYVYDFNGNRWFKTTTAAGAPISNPPYTPSAPSVQDGATDVSATPILTWSGGDPDSGDVVAYFIYFGECDQLLLVDSGIQPVFEPGPLEAFTTYCWRIDSRDNRNVETTGPVWTFTTTNDPPSIPSYLWPADGSLVYSSSAKLIWDSSDPNPSDEVIYEIYFGTSYPPPLIQSNYTGNSYVAGNLSNGSTYYWQIVAKDNHGYFSVGPVQSFSVDFINFGETLSGTFTGSTNEYRISFSASENDMVNIRLGFIGNLSPSLDMYAPDGSIFNCWPQSTTFAGNFILVSRPSCLLPYNGTYTIITENESGEFSLTIQRLNNTVPTMSFGENANASLIAISDSNIHTFTASANDSIAVRMGFTTPGPSPEISIYGPSGTPLSSCSSSEDNVNTYQLSATIYGCVLPYDGVYTILANERPGDDVGGYNLAIMQLNNTTATVSYGETISDTLTVTSDMNIHTFIASANDTVKVRMGFAANGPDPHMKIYKPDGSELCSAFYPNSTNKYPAEISSCVLPVSGTYTILTLEFRGDETGGDYTLNLECLSGICNRPPTANSGGPYPGEEGQSIILNASGSSDPDGIIAKYEWDINSNGTYECTSFEPVRTCSYTFAQQGTYPITLRVTDDHGAYGEAQTSAVISDTRPEADFTASPLSGTAPLTVNFSNTSIGYDWPLTYEWDFDNNGTPDSTEMIPAYTYNNAGIYSVKLIATDSDNSANTLLRTDYINVMPSCLPPVRIQGASPVYFSMLQDAYDSTAEGDTIQSQAVNFMEDLNINSNRSILFQGGYDCSYSVVTGRTIINGNMVLNNGKSTIENFSIEGGGGGDSMSSPSSPESMKDDFLLIDPSFPSHPTSTPEFIE